MRAEPSKHLSMMPPNSDLSEAGYSNCSGRASVSGANASDCM